jgi:hypothetical protein
VFTSFVTTCILINLVQVFRVINIMNQSINICKVPYANDLILMRAIYLFKKANSVSV